jgi:hypothetical protein
MRYAVEIKDEVDQQWRAVVFADTLKEAKTKAETLMDANPRIDLRIRWQRKAA